MIEEDMARLIELNEKIVSQNDEIIRLLLKLAGEDNNDSPNNSEVSGTEYGVLENEGGKILVDSALSGINLGSLSLAGLSKQNDENDSVDLGLSVNNGENLLDCELNIGEVFFMGYSYEGNANIYKLSIKESNEFKVSPKELEEEIRKLII